MSDRFVSLLKTIEDNTFLGLGILVLAIGFLLHFISPIEVFVEVWLFSLAGTIVLGLGLLLLGTGFIRFLAEANSAHSLNEKPISQKELEKKYSEVRLANSQAGTQAIEALADESKPLSRKEIAEKSGLSNTYAANVLKSFVEKGYVLEFQVRGVFYYALAEKGLKLCEDIKTATPVQKPIQPVSTRRTLADSWLNKNRSPYFSEKSTGGSRKLLPKQKIVLQQLVLIFGFLGGLYIHLGLNIGSVALSTTSLLLTLGVFAWLATAILCTRRLTGSLGIITLALAWMSGYIVVVGEPLTTLGIMLLMSSTTLGAFAALLSRTHNPLQP